MGGNEVKKRFYSCSFFSFYGLTAKQGWEVVGKGRKIFSRSGSCFKTPILIYSGRILANPGKYEKSGR